MGRVPRRGSCDSCTDFSTVEERRGFRGFLGAAAAHRLLALRAYRHAVRRCAPGMLQSAQCATNADAASNLPGSTAAFSAAAVALCAGRDVSGRCAYAVLRLLRTQATNACVSIPHLGKAWRGFEPGRAAPLLAGCCCWRLPPLRSAPAHDVRRCASPTLIYNLLRFGCGCGLHVSISSPNSSQEQTANTL
jgi:hypothetical protein